MPSRADIRAWIEANEDRRYEAYHDSKGILTVGIGFNLEEDYSPQCIEDLGVNYADLCAKKCSLNDDHVNALFDRNLDLMLSKVDTVIPGFYSHPDNVQLAVFDMAFNLGGTRFRKFVKFLDALDEKDYGRAADEMADSKWAKVDVPNRAARDIALVRKHSAA